ncbi:MAG: hypothetical protein DA408_07420 [Bacteroidetes bacterium]|nr:MAG: hypothetical protein DA408_07420 [Bacteroidota bacterium]
MTTPLRQHFLSVIILFGACFWLLPNLHATHIVGGEMGYTCLGNNQYEIRLTIYRDCFFGNPDAYFDDPASIGIFDNNNFLLQDIRINLMGDDTLSPVLTDECLVIPPTVCVHTTTYRTVVELLPRPGGYQLAYQRCCRNQTIANIVDPLGTGATYGVVISERALEECNSSAEFLQWPPLYICANEPIFFDQSAIDADGDSVVYRLCTPLTGATPNIPRPQPPNNPPYAPIVWNAPPYGVDNMLNGFTGGVPLRIDAQTGLLTGTPNTVGQFVVGICAEEYRNGELISTSRRDFQYNVGTCGQTTAAFFAPTVQCDGLEVQLLNQSVGTGNFLWIFGDLAAPLGTTTAANPSFTFPSTGTYTISLIAAPGEPCADTLTQEIQLLTLSLQPAFRLDTLRCGDSLVIQLSDLSVDSLAVITSWKWTLNGIVFSTQQNPLLTITTPGSYEIGLTLTAANGCQNGSFEALQPVSFIQETLPNDTLRICPGARVFLNPAFLPQYAYRWTPATGLDDPTAPNPLATPTVSTTYHLQLTDPTSGCTADRSIHVFVAPPLEVAVSPDVTTCEATVQLTASSPTGVRYWWSPFSDFSSQVAVGESYTVSPLGAATFYLQVIDAAGCSQIDSVSVNSQAVNLSIASRDTALCLGESIRLQVSNDDSNDLLSFQWQPADLILADANSGQPQVSIPTAGAQYFSFTATNQYGCQTQDSVLVTTIDTAQFGATLRYQQCSGLVVNFTATDPAAGIYVWHFGDPAAPQATATGASVAHTYAQAGTYDVMVTLPAFISCPDTAFLTVTVVPNGLIQPDFTWSYLSCADTATVLITDATTANGTTITAWQWYQNNTLLTTAPTFSLEIDTSQTLELTLLTFAANGCVDTVIRPLAIELISLHWTPALQLCPGESVRLNEAGNPAYTYQWSPGSSLSDTTSTSPLASPATSTTYTVTVTDPGSICERIFSTTVTVTEPISYTHTPDTVTCAQSLQLIAASNQAVTYRWAQDAAITQVLGTAATQQVSPVAGTTFYFELTNEQGCQVRDSIFVDGRGIDFTIDPTQTSCQGDTVRLRIVNTGPYPITTYSWSPAAAIISGATTETVLVSPTNGTRYDVRVSNDFGCQADTSVLVNVLNYQPPLTISPARDTLIAGAGQSVQLLATNNSNYTYQWTPAATLSASAIFNPVARPTETTLYQLRITDENGCSNTATALVVVFDSPCLAPYIFVPNAFTPNGDGRNDRLRVAGNVIENFHLAIYNRWGERVFESYRQDEGWDGTYDGELLSPDVFGYYLEVGCYGGEQYTTKGNITLIR